MVPRRTTAQPAPRTARPSAAAAQGARERSRARAQWRAQYAGLLDLVAAAVEGVPALDLTAELITHRFTPGSKEVLLGWYPRTQLDMDESTRTQKRNQFGGVKHVYPKDVMRELRGWFEAAIADRLPACRVLYWT